MNGRVREKMIELKKKVVNEFRTMVSDMVDSMKDAEKTGGGMDISTLWVKTADRFANLDLFFNEYSERIRGNKKKLF
jgi:hypothetical protein